MSADSGQGPAKTVVDEEGDVDTKLKTRIINIRERVDQREDELFVRAPADPDVRQLDPRRLVQAYGTIVRQYIRAIRPILRSEDVAKAKTYWLAVEIGEGVTVPPPDGKHEWSQFASDADADALKQSMGLPRAVDPPEPKTVTYQGLKQVLEQQEIDLTWTVCLNPQAIPPQQEFDRLAVSYPTPKSILDDAVAKADEFLQEAGMGFDIDTDGTDIIRDFDASNGEASSQYGTGDYDSNPDL